MDVFVPKFHQKRIAKPSVAQQIPLLAFGLGMSDQTVRTALYPGGRERMTRLLRLIETGRVDPTPMTTHRFPFSQVERAFQMMVTKEENIIKPLITFS